MSRIGNRIITVPTGVTVEETNGVVTVKGPKGSLSQPMLKDITMKVEENQVIVERKNEAAKALHGTMNALIQNMITGVTEGYSKNLSIMAFVTAVKFHLGATAPFLSIESRKLALFTSEPSHKSSPFPLIPCPGIWVCNETRCWAI